MDGSEMMQETIDDIVGVLRITNWIFQDQCRSKLANTLPKNEKGGLGKTVSRSCYSHTFWVVENTRQSSALYECFLLSLTDTVPLSSPI